MQKFEYYEMDEECILYGIQYGVVILSGTLTPVAVFLPTAAICWYIGQPPFCPFLWKENVNRLPIRPSSTVILIIITNLIRISLIGQHGGAVGSVAGS